MQISKGSKTRYCYEYAFWDTVNSYNESRQGGKGVIRTSEARKFRNELTARLKSQNTGLENCTVSMFTQEVNNIFTERMGYAPYQEANPKDEAYRKQFNSYKNMTGVRQGSDELTGDYNFLPISPYDPRWSWRKGLREQGSRLASVRVDDVENIDGFDRDFAANVEVELYGAPELRQGRNGNPYYQANEVGIKLLEDDDRSGMTMLAPYMSRSEYNDVVEWVNRDLQNEEPTYNNVLNRRRNMQKSVSILKELSKMGRGYSISRDEYPGQIKANVDGTKLNVRITEKKGTEQYVGSLYDDGVRYLFSTTKKRQGSHGNEMHTPSIEDVLNLTRFALGEPVNRKDSNLMVGAYEQTERGEGRGFREYNASYLNQRGLTMVYDNVATNTEEEKRQERGYRNKVRINVDTKNRTNDTTPMNSPDEARVYLEEAILRARGAYTNALDVDRLIEEAREHGGDEDYNPIYDGDPDLAVIQQSYWDVLTGKKDSLIIPGREEEDTVGDIGELAARSLEVEIAMAKAHSYSPSEMTPDEMVRQHAIDNLKVMFGEYDIQGDGLRFDPVNVAKWDESGYGVYRNNDDILKAMKLLDMSADELRGNDFYNMSVKDRLVKFEPDTAVKMRDMDNPYVQSMYEEITQSLSTKGLIFDEDDILFDENGIVQYKARYATHESIRDGKGANRPLREITGHIGQIFVPKENDVVITKYAGSENFAFVPGYQAHVRHPEVGENTSMEERTLLTGYEQRMRENIRYRILQDVLDAGQNDDVIGSTTGINNTYRSLDAERYDVDFERVYVEQGMEPDVLEAIIKTQSQRVRYSNEIRDGSSIHADFRAGMYQNYDYANDNFGDAYSITGNRNISVLSAESDGYYDPIATTATSTNQGAVRYLIDGAVVNADKTITPGAKDGRCALMNHELARFSQYDPYDRQCMMLSNMMQANSVSRPVKSMDITLGSWTQDDAIVVSKRFAENHPMRNNDGSLRPLVRQDKLSDLHGNKGVISYVVDSDKSLDEVRQECLDIGYTEDKIGSLLELHRWAKSNPEVDVYMAPFTQPSRFNAGTAREKMSESFDAYTPSGEFIPGAVGTARFIITDKSVEAKTHVYDEEEVLKGKGRKASGQLAWSLTSKDSQAIMREFFGPNSENLVNVREYLLTMGLDITETGEVIVGYEPHDGEERNVFEMPELEHRQLQNGQRVDTGKMNRDFMNQLSRRGGIIELPFPLKYPTGEDIPPMDDGKRDVVYTQQQWERKGYTRKDGVYVRPTTVNRRLEVGQRQTDNVSWGLPVMSAHLRSGQEFVDGTSMAHDYTNQYLDIFTQSVLYRDAKESLTSAPEGERGDIESRMKAYQQSAQDAYNNITGDIEKRKVLGKHNMFRDGVMSRRVPNSATSVWSPDPRLDIDQIAVGTKIAETLGIDPNSQEPQEVLVWRDPILHDSNIRYMKIMVDPNMSGCAINPNMDTPFDGDFDGDTVALVKLHSKAAQKEARAKWGVGANLVDTSHKTKVFDKSLGEEVEVYPLNMNDGLDVQVARFYYPDMDERWNDLTLRANQMYHDEKEGQVRGFKVFRLQDEFISDMSDFYREAAVQSTGLSVIEYRDMGNHLDSVYNANIRTGAKGSPAKFKDYTVYLGADGVELTEDGVDLSNVKDNKTTMATREMNQGVMIATNVKNVGTGFAGSFSQRAMRAIGHIDPKAATELTYPATQSILQSKHDPVDAKRRFGMLIGPMRKLWDGKSVEYNEKSEQWVNLKEQAKPDEWRKSFVDFYTSAHGMGVKINPEYVDRLVTAMTDDHMGTIISTEAEAEANDGKTSGTLLYRMAYGGSFETLHEAAKNRENLFEGKYVENFTPSSVKNNQRVAQGLEANKGEYRPLIKSDVVKDGKDKRISSMKSVAIDNPEPRRTLNVDVDVIIRNGEKPKDGDFGDSY